MPVAERDILTPSVRLDIIPALIVRREPGGSVADGDEVARILDLSGSDVIPSAQRKSIGGVAFEINGEPEPQAKLSVLPSRAQFIVSITEIVLD
jgi:hypothetical protein